MDLAGAYVAPGLANMHVHFGLILPGPDRHRSSNSSDAALALRMADSARATLRSGVTTVRLTGEENHVDMDLRDAIREGRAEGPRIFTAGIGIVCTGGHGHDVGFVEADGVAEFRRATRQQLKAGADFIKICISGGIAGERESISDVQLTRDEIRAVTEVAHARGKKVAAHAGPADAVRTGIECGIDCIEHGYFLDDETVKLMAERGTWYVPTIGVSRCQEFYDKIQAPEWMVSKALAAGELHWEALQKAISAGVRIAPGTDIMPFESFGETTSTVRELEFLVEAGMSPVDALRAATVRAAEFFDAQHEFGSVAPGLAADLIGMSENPLENASALREIFLVIKDGRIVLNDRAFTERVMLAERA